MQMRPAIQIQSIVKAMTDVVLPALDPANKLAQEQARLVIGLLGLMASQLPTQFAFDCDELERLLAFSHELQNHAHGGAETAAAVTALAEAAAEAGRVLDGARSSPVEVEAAVRALRSLSGDVITQVHVDGEAAARAAVQAAVLRMSKAQLLRDRAAMLPQGWEPDPAAIPPLASLLGTAD